MTQYSPGCNRRNRAVFLEITWVAVIALGMIHGSVAALAQQLAVIPQGTSSIASLEIVTERGIRIGSGMIVDEPGLLLTSFRLVQGATRIRVVFEGEKPAEIVGVVAARRGSDLVLLKLRNAPETAKPIPLATRRVQFDDPIWLHAGIRSLPTAINSGKVRGVRSGNEQAAHWEIPGTIDPNSWWIVCDSLLPPSGMGGALLTPTGELQGVMVGPVDRCEEVHVAVDVSAIRALLNLDRERVLPLASLRKHEDQVADRRPPGLDSESLPAELRRLRLPIAAQLDELRRELLAVDGSLPEIRRRQDHWRDVGVEKTAQANSLDKDANRLRREREAIRPEVQRSRTVEREIVETDSKGRRKTRTVKETEYYYEFSDRQLKQIAELNQLESNRRGELEGLRLLLRISQLQLGVAQREEAGQKKYLERTWDGLFWLADPLELHSADSAREFSAALPRLVDSLGTSPPIIVAQAIAHLRLRQLDACEASLQQAHDLDRGCFPLTQAIRARVAALRNESGRAKKFLDEALRKGKGDVRIQVVQARLLLDQREASAAARLLLRAVAQEDVPPSLLAAVVLVQSSASDSKTQNPKKALQFARQACDRSAWQEGLPLLSLAWATAADGEFQQAAEWLELAASLPVGIEPARFEAWREQLKRGERLSFDWNSEP